MVVEESAGLCWSGTATTKIDPHSGKTIYLNSSTINSILLVIDCVKISIPDLLAKTEDLHSLCGLKVHFMKSRVK